MKRFIYLGVFLLSVSCAKSQNGFYQFVDSAMNISDSASRVAFVENYVGYIQGEGTPVIEIDTANFIYYGNANKVEIAGDFNRWGNDGVWVCERIEQTNFFYYSRVFEPTARLDYKLIVDGSWILDPLNPNQVSGGYGPNSELAMSAYVQPWEIQQYENVAKGTLESFSLKSEALNKTFKIKVYLPSNYNSLNELSTVYVHDGQEYLTLGSMKNVLDNLIDSNKIDPVIAVFIEPINRMDEYMNAERFDYAQFVTSTLVPYIDQNYKTNDSKDYRLTMGTSLGGNISGLIAYNHPDVFANSGWHSPALWVNEQEVANLYKTEAKDVKIYFNVGTYEDLGVDWDVFTNRLSELEIEHKWEQYHEAHSWGFWRATTDNILEFFFQKGTTPVAINTSKAHGFSLGQNYPNPSKSISIIPLSVNTPGEYIFELINSAGQTILTRKMNYDSQGDFEIIIDMNKLSSGIFLYSLKNNTSSLSKKMVIQ